MTPDPWWARIIKKMAASRPASKILARILLPVDLGFVKLSRGRKTLTQLLTGLDVVCVETIGARTKQIRPVMLAAARHGQAWLLAATNFGAPTHPAWYYNLLRFPEVDVNFLGDVQKFRARLITADERARYWSKLVEAYRGFEAYRQRAGGRVIPVFVLEPIDS
jgi:deazaflavin-dependent oxidoreductase (nitroreductase family)